MKTNYFLEGPAKAPVVVMAHALGATLRLWDAQAAALADRYRVLRYDVRGHGESEVPPGPYTAASGWLWPPRPPTSSRASSYATRRPATARRRNPAGTSGSASPRRRA
ncbi:MAG: hypothetical protein DME15_15590 [Candidatus Rokuibacteriota bacterium]|nr:MAG: hypothetical protein DME15_15590 [Candidatus Rokubacteria bacterium]